MSEDAVLVKALSNEVVSVIRDLVKANPLFREQTQYFTSRVDLGDPFKLADFAASLTTAEGFELQVCVLREVESMRESKGQEKRGKTHRCSHTCQKKGCSRTHTRLIEVAPVSLYQMRLYLGVCFTVINTRCLHYTGRVRREVSRGAASESTLVSDQGAGIDASASRDQEPSRSENVQDAARLFLERAAQVHQERARPGERRQGSAVAKVQRPNAACSGFAGESAKGKEIAFTFKSESESVVEVD